MTSRYEAARAVIVGRLVSSAGGASVQQLSEWGADKRLIQKMCADGTLRRVKRGYYTLGGVASDDHWQRLRSEHLRLVAAMTNDHTVAGFRSAALAFGLPVSDIPDEPEVIRPPTMSSLGRTRTLRRPLDDGEITSVRAVPVTTIERTAVDVALDLPTPQALITLDAALRRGASRTLLLHNLSSLGSVRGCRTARQTIAWADPHSESALESRGRGELLIRGVPPPWCNVSFRMGDTEFRVDKWWPVIALVGEADGAVKYRGATNRPFALGEKRRQDWFEDVLGARRYSVSSTARFGSHQRPSSTGGREGRNERPRNYGYRLTGLRSFNDHHRAQARHGTGCSAEMGLRDTNQPDSGSDCPSGPSRRHPTSVASVRREARRSGRTRQRPAGRGRPGARPGSGVRAPRRSRPRSDACARRELRPRPRWSARRPLHDSSA